MSATPAGGIPSFERLFAVTALAAALALGSMADAASALAQDSGQPAAQDVPYVPTPWPVVRTMLDLAKVGADDVLIDLGSGDGRIVIEAARSRGARGIGVELDAELVRISNLEAARLGVADRAQFLRQDLFETDLTAATVITMYLLPQLIRELRPRLSTRLKPGTRIVSHDFGMEEWRPDAQVEVAVDKATYGPGRSTVYLWVVPAFVQGVWEGSFRQGARSQTYRLDLRQNFQQVSGSLRVLDRTAQLEQAMLVGDRLTISAIIGAGGAAVRHRFDGRSVAGELVGYWSVAPAAAKPAAGPATAEPAGEHSRARRVDPRGATARTP